MKEKEITEGIHPVPPRHHKRAATTGLNLSQIEDSSVELEGVDTKDYPDFVDAYVSAANYVSGQPLSDDELENLNTNHAEYVQQKAHEKYF